MKALVYRDYGPPERLGFEELPVPAIGDGDVLVKVHAVSLNGSDWETLAGSPAYARIGGWKRPARPVLGSDIAGTVVAAGAKVTGFRPGDAVFGDLIDVHGGLAEFVRAPAKALAKKPDGLSFTDAAAIPQAAVIALRAMKKGKVGPGTKLLINGAGGGAGSFAVQMAKRAGAEVTAVDNAGKAAFLRTLGADHVIDYAAEDFAVAGRAYDVILDIHATRPVFAVQKALRRGGSYFFTGGAMATLLQIVVLGGLVRLATGRRVRLLIVRPDPAGMVAAAGMVLRGEIRVAVDRVFPFAEAVEAFRRLGAGKALGKVVVAVAE